MPVEVLGEPHMVMNVIKGTFEVLEWDPSRVTESWTATSLQTNCESHTVFKKGKQKIPPPQKQTNKKNHWELQNSFWSLLYMAATVLLNCFSGGLTVVQVQARCDSRQHPRSVWQWGMLQSSGKKARLSLDAAFSLLKSIWQLLSNSSLKMCCCCTFTWL